jgi:cellulose synthase/poly-beta-1,6-N-acetylglucosamine synthase-like glycosyltransferase
MRRTERLWSKIDWVAVGAVLVPISISLLEVGRSSRATVEKGHLAEAPAEAPGVTFIVCAYLPNERHVLVDTVMNLLRTRLAGGREVIVVHNGPGHARVEWQLMRLTASEPLRVIYVSNSTSKAENLSVAIQAARYGVVAIYDADCRPDDGSAERAQQVLATGVDVVQGASDIRGAGTILRELVGRELRQSYLNAKLARGRDGMAYFSGSNAYWRREVLEALSVSSQCLTEDIELSMRAHLAGVRFAYDPSITCTELAPDTWVGWWHQRRRWIWGWLQSSAMHGEQLVRATRGRPRLWWIYLMLGRRLMPALGVAWLMYRRTLTPRRIAGWAGLSIFVDMVSGDIESDAERRASLSSRLLVPGYELMKHLVTLSVLVAPPRRFHVTPRRANTEHSVPASHMAWTACDADVQTLEASVVNQ